MEMWHEVLEVGPARSAKTRRKSRSEPARIPEKGLLQAAGKAPEAEYARCAAVIAQVFRKQ